jgi:hypothetical protein
VQSVDLFEFLNSNADKMNSSDNLIKALIEHNEKEICNIIAYMAKHGECASTEACKFAITENRADILVQLRYDSEQHSNTTWSIIHCAIEHGYSDTVFDWLCKQHDPLYILPQYMRSINGVVYVENNIDWFIHKCGIDQVTKVLETWGRLDILAMQKGIYDDMSI